MASWSALESSSGSTGEGVRIAVDAMGGDHGPAEVVPGAIDYAIAHPRDVILLVGQEDRIRAMLGRMSA